MINIYEKSGKINISTIDNQDLQEEKLFKGSKEIKMKNQLINISEVPKNNNYLEVMPYSNVKNLLLVEIESLDFQGGFNLVCNEGEYFLAIEQFYFELLDDLYSRDISNSELVEIGSVLHPFLSSKVELFQYTKLEEGSIKGQFKKREINDLLYYSEAEKEIINQLLLSSPSLRLKSLFDYSREKIESPKRKFYILINKLSNKNKYLIPENNGTLLPSDLNTNQTDKPILILVHGLASSCRIQKENYKELTEYLVPDFYVFTYEYYTVNQPIHCSGKLLANKIKILREEYGNRDIFIVAHSMGGLVSRSAIEEHKAQVDYLITAGTPNNGSLPCKLGRITKTSLFLFNHNKIKYQDFHDLIYNQIKGLEDLSRKNNYIKKLNEVGLYNHDTYHSIAGNAFRMLEIPDTISSDGVVSVNNMTNVNGQKISNIILGNWSHFNYFTKNFESSFGKLIDKLLIKQKVTE